MGLAPYGKPLYKDLIYKKLIDLTDIPENIQESIINNFNGQSKTPNMKVLNYLIKKRCNHLIEVVEEFYNG